ncbi:Flagellar basal-body rod protein FlgF [hydrothermal vent metagenome]|uniref:Flagellar basal-body rod protein FlgF n=1 Tax=hydrothermal vent metagenome TaxID=652676 RepID=A0A3B0RKC9_9ZZZZ
MNFQPLIPLNGLPGWVLLNKTLEQQTEVFNKSPQIIRDTEYFEQNIGSVLTAEDLVSDRRLLRVALGAFGLSDQINDRALLQKVLEEGTEDRGALANRLGDNRYKQLADAFGFADEIIPSTILLSFGPDITDKYRQREFEVAVGEQDESLRLAMNLKREIGDLVSSDSPNDTIWFRIMGTPPLRKVFEVALGLPSSFGQLGIDRQLEIFKDQTRNQFGVNQLSELTDDDLQEQLIRRYLLRDQIAAIQVQSSSAIALTLLQSVPRVF